MKKCSGGCKSKDLKPYRVEKTEDGVNVIFKCKRYGNIDKNN